MIVNETILNSLANSTVNGTLNVTKPVIFFNNMIPAGCNPTIDRIVFERGAVICYHQYTVQEIIDKLVPAFAIFAVVIAYISYKFMLPRLKNSGRFKTYIEKRNQVDER